METVQRKRIEIIADAPIVPRIVAACTAVGIGGHSIARLSGGHGRSGDWQEDGMTSAESKVMVMTVTSTDKADRLVEALAPVLDSHRLLLTIADVAVVRGERFV
ncbi:MAG: P-II family nitrogen regulator [Sphingomonadaceae bacterium]